MVAGCIALGQYVHPGLGDCHIDVLESSRAVPEANRRCRYTGRWLTHTQMGVPVVRG